MNQKGKKTKGLAVVMLVMILVTSVPALASLNESYSTNTSASANATADLLANTTNVTQPPSYSDTSNLTNAVNGTVNESVDTEDTNATSNLGLNETNNTSNVSNINITPPASVNQSEERNATTVIEPIIFEKPAKKDRDTGWKARYALYKEITSLRDYSVKHFDLGNGERVAIDSSSLLHYYDGEKFEEIPDLPFPEGIELVDKKDEHYIMSFPDWCTARVEDEGRVVRCYDRRKHPIYEFKDLIVVEKGVLPYKEIKMVESDGEEKTVIDKEKVDYCQFKVIDNDMYLVVPDNLKNSYPLQAYDDVDTSATNNADSRIHEDLPTSKHGGSTILFVQAGPYYFEEEWIKQRRRIVMDWTLPSGTGDVSAIKLFLYKYGSTGASTYNVEVHEILESFVEGDVTWNSREEEVFWTDPGCGSPDSSSATVVDSFPRTTTSNEWHVWDLGPGADNPMSITWDSNFDITLRESTDTGTSTDYEKFRSKEYASTDPNLVPYIEITYSAAAPLAPPATPYMIYGWVFNKDGTACNNPVVNITNMDNSKQWQAKRHPDYNFYQRILANGTDLNASEVLQFDVTSPDGKQFKVFNHTVNEAEVNNGGVFEFNVTLEEAPETPFIIYGWVFYENDEPCDNPAVTINNTNTSMQWLAETNASYNYYQLMLGTTNVSVDNVIEFNATDGTQFNVTNHTVTQDDINSGGLFDFNLTLTTPAADPTVESITITPDDEHSEGGVQINPNAGNNKTVNISAVVSDPDGWEDITLVEAVITGPGTVADSPVTLSLASHDTTTATFNGTFNMSFYYLSGEYTVNVTATDYSSLTDSNSTTFEYQTAIALELDAGTIAFGSVDPNETSEVLGDKDMGTPNNATVRNIGNVIIDVEVSGMDMTYGSNVITKDNIEAQIDALGYRDMSEARCFDVNMSIGFSSLENADFKLYVPYGTPQGGYSGTITLTATTC